MRIERVGHFNRGGSSCNKGICLANHKITQIFTREYEDTRSQRTEVRILFSVFCYLFSDFWSEILWVFSSAIQIPSDKDHFREIVKEVEIPQNKRDRG